ncbi:MAG: hypothetical protein Q7U05_00820 [Polaromonas sp.]|nr:hypothetical protein [Polaromonas sp.]
MQRWLWAGLLALTAQAATAFEPPDDALRYVAEILLNGLVIEDYHDVLVTADETLYFPAALVLRAGEATATQEGDALTLEVASTQSRLLLDLERRALETNDSARPLTAADALLVDGQVLVAAQVMAEVFGMEIKLNAVNQQLVIKTKRPWPRDLRLARERRWDRLGVPSELETPVILQNQGYRAWGTPQADVAISWQRSGDGRNSASYNALVVAEALGLTNNVFISGEPGGDVNSVRLRSGRQSARGGVFGVAPLYDFQMGDISGMRSPLVGQGGSGRGLRYQATPLGRASNFDRTVIEGDAQPGWDAELHLGNQLMDFQRVSSNGRYRFVDVPLDYGVNNIKVVLYGPQGQVREEVYREQIGGSMVPVGDFYSSGYALQPNTRLFDMDQAGISQPVADPGWAWGWQGDYGLSKALTLGTFVAGSHYTDPLGRVDASGGVLRVPETYYGLALRPAMGNMALEGGLVTRTGGGAATYVRLAMPLGRMSLSLTHDQYGSDYLAQDNESGLVASRSRVGFGIPLGWTGADLGAVGVSLALIRQFDKNEFLKTTLNYGHRVSGLQVGHQLETETRSSPGGAGSRTGLYRLQSSQRMGVMDYRAEMRYGLYGTGFQSATVTGLWRQNDLENIVGTVAYSPDSTSYGVGWSTSTRYGALTLSATYAGGDVSVGLGWSFSMGYSPTRGLDLRNRASAGMGLADVLIYEDVTADGIYTPGVDRPVENASILLNKRQLRDMATDAEGRIRLNQLSITEPLVISTSGGSIPDAFLVPMYPAIQSWPRPGQSLAVNYPVVESGQISGLVKIQLKPAAVDKAKDKSSREAEVLQERGLSGVLLQVLTADGRLHAETRTLSDGYFSFETVYPGRWKVRLAAGQDWYGAKLDSSSQAIELTVADGIRDDVSIRFQSDGKGL